MKNVVLSFALAPLALLSSCAVAAVGLGAVVVTEEFQNNALVASVEEDVDVVWASTKKSLAHMTDALLHVDEAARVAETRVDNAVVTIQVRNSNVGETEIRVAAKKYMFYNQEVAQIVQRRLVKELHQ